MHFPIFISKVRHAAPRKPSPSAQVWLSPAPRDDAPSSAPMQIRGNDHQPGITSAPALTTHPNLAASSSPPFPSSHPSGLPPTSPNTTIQSNPPAVRPPSPSRNYKTAGPLRRARIASHCIAPLRRRVARSTSTTAPKDPVHTTTHTHLRAPAAHAHTITCHVLLLHLRNPQYFPLPLITNIDQRRQAHS